MEMDWGLFTVEWGTMFFMLAAFIVLLYLLWKFAFGPLMKTMDDRADKIENDLQTAEQSRKEAEQYLREQQQALDEARQDAKQIIDNAYSTSEKQKEDILQSARDEAEQYKQVARNEITREKEQAIEALRAELGVLSAELAGKVLQKEVKGDDQQQLVDNYLKEVGNKRWLQ